MGILYRHNLISVKYLMILTRIAITEIQAQHVAKTMIIKVIMEKHS